MPRRPLVIPLALALFVPSLSAAIAPHQRDLETLAGLSSLVVRARVVSVEGGGSAEDPLRLGLEPLAVLAGEAPAPLVLPVRNERPLRPAVGEQGLFFAAAGGDGTLACIQGASERWAVPAEAAEGADLFVRGLLGLAPEAPAAERLDVYLSGLRVGTLRLAAFAAQRVALLAKESGLSAEQREVVLAFLGDGRIAAADEVKAGLVQALGAELPLAEVLELARRAPPESRTRVALLELTGARAVEAEPDAADRARGMLGAARQSKSPEVALAAAAGLAGLGDEAALRVVAEALSSGEPAQRAEAVLVLGKLAEKGSRAARVELGRLSSDEDERVRTRAAAALRQAYFGDPLRARRSRGSLALASVALVMLAGALLALRRGGRAG